ncbi:MAG: heparinase [Ignavibacteria bacterium]|nr:MAG: heparinase [Ignavibacteria bacterium]
MINLIAQPYFNKNDFDTHFINLLSNSNEYLKSARVLWANGEESKAISMITDYFSSQMSKRFFFDWKEFDKIFSEYREGYSNKFEEHSRRANEMLSLYQSPNTWKLPQKAKTGLNLTSYQFRHLSRQHKAFDIALIYWLNPNNELIEYLNNFVISLEKAYLSGEYEKSGNGVFESFRAGYRVFNWLYVYNMLLSSETFSKEAQFRFLKSFYYHAQELYKQTKKFRYGNHHTKGVMALSLISILFPEFDTEKIWLKHSLEMLEMHLRKEVNEDGFQSERSVHYHMGDIYNYLYTYILAKKNKVELSGIFLESYYKMFECLTKIAYPNKTLPVLQDDTDQPFAEFNQIDNMMAIGAVIFEEPKFKYFSSDRVSPKDYWVFGSSMHDKLTLITKSKPEFNSVSLPQTGYYAFRSGWNKDDFTIILSNGLNERKPDHQHGDMLGIQAYGYNAYLLPNYQTRYNVSEFPYFKNSFAKNICIVDSIPLGLNWKQNSGKSGFGKFKTLPHPRTLSWINGKQFDFYLGTHDAYAKINVDYKRGLLFFKDNFAIVIDDFHSSGEHSYQQIWQGDFDDYDKRLYRLVKQNGAGLDIYQFINAGYTITKSTTLGKSNTIIETKDKDFTFVSLLYPYSVIDYRLDENSIGKKMVVNGWEFSSCWNETKNCDADLFAKKGNDRVLINFTEYKDNLFQLTSEEKISVFIEGNQIYNLTGNEIRFNLNGKNITIPLADKIVVKE